MRKVLTFFGALLLVCIVGRLGVENPTFGGKFKKNIATGASPPPFVYEKISWTKPTTDKQWIEDIRKESLHLKYDDQLQQMYDMHLAKVDTVSSSLDNYILFDGIKEKARIIENLEFQGYEGQALTDELDTIFAEGKSELEWLKDKLNQSVERIAKTQELRGSGKITVIDKIPAGRPERLVLGSDFHSPLGTTYFIDADCATPGDGTTATCNGDADDSYDDVEDFTATARSPGDVAILRRDRTADYDNGTDWSFTSDGAIGNPITVRADYEDVWGDFTSSSVTLTATFGSKYMATSASSTNLQAGDWIFLQGDSEWDYSYMIQSASSTGIQFFLPYLGDQSGAGITANIMGQAPKWNSAKASLQVSYLSVKRWIMRGIYIGSTDPQGLVSFSNGDEGYFRDMYFNGANGVEGIFNVGITIGGYYLDNSIFEDVEFCFANTRNDNVMKGQHNNIYCDVNGNNPNAMYITHGDVLFENLEAKGHTTAVFQSNNRTLNLKLRNNYPASPDFYDNFHGVIENDILVEDFNMIKDNTKRRGPANDGITANKWVFESSTTTPRVGGAETSYRIDPSQSSFVTSSYRLGYLDVIDYPIYADTTSKTYTFYFKADDNTDWDSNPTADELWVECSMYGSADNTFRKMVKSTGTVDFKTDTDFDQSLSVTCQPSQSGTLFLRVFYAKPAESGNSNIFYIDPLPEVI